MIHFKNILTDLFLVYITILYKFFYRAVRDIYTAGIYNAEKAVKHKMVTDLTLPSQSKFKHAFSNSCALAKSTRVSSTETPGSAHHAHRKSFHTPIMSPDLALD